MHLSQFVSLLPSSPMLLLVPLLPLLPSNCNGKLSPLLLAMISVDELLLSIQTRINKDFCNMVQFISWIGGGGIDQLDWWWWDWLQHCAIILVHFHADQMLHKPWKNKQLGEPYKVLSIIHMLCPHAGVVCAKCNVHVLLIDRYGYSSKLEQLKWRNSMRVIW